MTELPPETAAASRRDILIDEITDWLMEQALKGSTLESLLRGTLDGMIAAGLPIARANVGMTTLHPLFEAISYTWTVERGLVEERFPHRDDGISEEWRLSPLKWLIERKLPVLRRRLAGPEAMLDFPLLVDLAEQGYTDYLGWLAVFEEDRYDGAVGSFATMRPAGFTEPQIAAIRRIQARLAVALKVVMREQLTHNVLSAYLGAAAADRVLDGQIKRGDGQTVQAAIWYSDLRGSTELAEQLEAETFLETLDTYFDATAGAVIAEGGQVLLLIGDAVLAIFPVEEGGAADACRQALAATQRAYADMADINARRTVDGAPPLRFGLGLHVGELLFGNIGTRERLEFTVVGRAVNVAARLEELSKTLDRSVLASTDFAKLLPSEAWEALGARELRGLADPVEVMTLAVEHPLERIQEAERRKA
ncbi:adenylate/guanylate cyclase domain-containing protein [Algihabitans albus]|uniref:adenylate/guanylate cyclase domain-containing protein n=1 Tax=Algihabitans albus TaxID=2164067 RepID=UPI000E5C9F3B|nr:adenylate/guanylate cyclase domain-containing protein [Algihabitans albus]